MTESEVRDVVVRAARAWYGRSEHDGTHREIIDVYNSQTNLPRGYRVKYTDEWCATFVSAVAIATDLTPIIPTECGCDPMIEKYMTHQVSRWREDENFTPQPGDVIFYDWDDAGGGDDRGSSDHVGIVERVENGDIYVIEGNISDRVGRRRIAVNGRYIRGYGLPAYHLYADGKPVSGKEEDMKRYNTVDELPSWAVPAITKLITKGALTGSGKIKDSKGRPADLDLSEDMVRIFVVLNRMGTLG